MSRSTALDWFEQNVVFRISRGFFLVLTFIAMIAVIGAAIYLLYGISPTQKASISEDALVTVSPAEVSAKIDSTSDAASVTPATKGKDQATPADPDKQLFEAYVDTLRTLLPPSTYPWSPQGYYTGYYSWERRFVTTNEGIIKKLQSLLETLNGHKEYDHALKQLCAVLRTFPEDKRLTPLENFILIYKVKVADHRASLVAANQEFQAAVEHKSAATSQSLIAIGGSLSVTAFLAILLVLLSIQRHLSLIRKSSGTNAVNGATQ
jgi:hypothetical protein